MRTTIDLPDDLARAAKVAAAQRGETLKEMLTRAIAREVAAARPAPRSRRTPPLIGTRTGDGYDVTADDIANAVSDDDRRYAS